MTLKTFLEWTHKLKIILWYTGLLSAILIGVFFSLYSILGYQLRKEIDSNINEKIKKINSLLRDTKKPPKPDERFLEYIVVRRHRSFYDIREHTDIVDDKYILVVFCGDELMYFSNKYKSHSRTGYKPIEESIKQLNINESSNESFIFNDIPFSISAINKVGYSIYVGYELSTIIAMQKKILQIFLIVFPFGVIFSILCGYFVTQQLLIVINRITKTAASITSKNLSERIKVSGGKNEITNLVKLET